MCFCIVYANMFYQVPGFMFLSFFFLLYHVFMRWRFYIRAGCLPCFFRHVKCNVFFYPVCWVRGLHMPLHCVGQHVLSSALVYAILNFVGLYHVFKDWHFLYLAGLSVMIFFDMLNAMVF